MTRTKNMEQLTDSYHLHLHKLVAEANPFASRENFARWTQVQYQFQAAIAPMYISPSLRRLMPDLENRSRLALTQADLADLHMSVPEVPDIVTQKMTDAQMLGWLYVSEGSTLGAAVLRKKAAKFLGLSDSFGARHLSASTQGRMAQWKRFVDVINNVDLSDAEVQQMQGASIAAFELFSELLTQAYNIETFEA